MEKKNNSNSNRQILLCNSNCSLHKKISEKKSSWCTDGSMNALADKKYTNKKCHAHSDLHSIHMAILFNSHPYISSSKCSVNWRATATYVGMVEARCIICTLGQTNVCSWKTDLHLSHLTPALSGPVEAYRRNIFIPKRCRLTDSNFEKLMHLLISRKKFKQSLTSKYKQHAMHDSMYN